MTLSSFLNNIRVTPLQTMHIIVFTIMMVVKTAGELQCHQAQKNCIARMGCSMAMRSYMYHCGQVIHGEINSCPSRCRKALISLLSTEDQEGEAFMECDCNGNRYCYTQKQRMEVCSYDVLTAMENVQNESTVISCSLAEQICRADTSCLTALSYFDLHCSKLQSGQKCTSRCNNSLSILFRQTKARKLRTCICDGTETYPCHVVQESIDRLCYHGRRHRHHGRHHNHTRTHSTKHQEKDKTNTQNNKEDDIKQLNNIDCSNTSSNGNSINSSSQSIVFSFKIQAWIILTFVFQLVSRIDIYTTV